MALCVPLVTRPRYANSCVGNFFGTDCAHSAIPNGHCIDFEIAEAESPSVYSRLSKRVIAQGQLLKTFCVPINGDGPDILGVLGRSQKSSEGPNDRVVTDKIQFFLFDSSKEDFVCTGEFKCTIFQSSMGDLYTPTTSVCNLPCSNKGKVIYTNGRHGEVYFIDPVSFTNESRHKFPEFRSPSKPMKCFWLSESELAFVHETKHLTAFLFARINKQSGGSKKPTFKLKKHSSALKSNSERTCWVAKVPGRATNLLAVIYPKTVLILKPERSGVKEVKSLTIPFDQSLERTWWPLIDADGTVTFISTNQEAFQLGDDTTLKPLEYKSESPSRIAQLGPNNHFSSQKDGSESVIVVKVGISDDKVIETSLQSSYLIFEDFEISYHYFDDTFGSDYGANFRYIHNPAVRVQSRKCSKSKYCELQDFFQDVILGVWPMSPDDDVFLVSTQKTSSLLSLKKEGLKFKLTELNAPSWMDLEARTLFAQPGVQVTETSIRRENAEPQKINMPGVESVISTFDSIVLATTLDLLVQSEGSKSTRLGFEDAIVAMASDGSHLIVLFSQRLLVYDMTSLDATSEPINTFEFTIAATCLAHLSEGKYIVGFSDGSATILPENRPLKLCTGSICSLYYDKPLDSLIVVCLEEIDFYEFSSQTIVEGPRGNFSHLAKRESSNLGLVAKNGALGAIELFGGSEFVHKILRNFGNQPTMNYRPYLESSVIALDPQERKIAISDLTDPSYQRSCLLPDVLEDLEEPHSQLFLVGDTKILEVAHSHVGSTRSESESEDEDDDFIVQVKLLLYEILTDIDSITLTCLSSQTQRLAGDPFDEVIVKFITPSRFNVFTYSVDCLPCNIVDKAIELGQPIGSSDYVYDDHWIFDEARGLIHAIAFTGSIDSEKADEFDIGNQPYPHPRNPLKLIEFSREMITDALMTNHSRASGAKPRFAMIMKQPNNESASEFTIFDYDANVREVTTLSRTTLPCRGAKLLAVNDRMKQWLDGKLRALSIDYVFVPEVIVSYPDGSLNLIASVKDAELLSSLLEIQKHFLNDLGFLSAQNVIENQSQEPDLLNGAILKEALAAPDLHHVFLERGLDPARLCLSIKLLEF